MEDRTFGIEIEVISDGMGRSSLARFITQQTGLRCEHAGYDHETRSYWRVTTDRSLGDMSAGAEIVSPILRGEEGLRQVALVANALRDAGCRVTAKCGVHVHIGVGDCSFKEIRRVCMNFLNIEPMFDLILPDSRRGNNNHFIKSNRGRFAINSYDPFTKYSVENGFRQLRAANSMDQLIEIFQGNPYYDPAARYYKMNLHSFVRQGTIEFRHHSGTTDAEKLCNWIRLLMSLTCYSLKASPRPCAERPEKLFNMFFGLFTDLKPLRPYYVKRWNELSGMRQKTCKDGAHRQPDQQLRPERIDATERWMTYDPFRDEFGRGRIIGHSPRFIIRD